MIKINKIIPLFSLLLTLMLSPYAISQVVDVSDCRLVEDSLERFNCYETLGPFDDQGTSEVNVEVDPLGEELTVVPTPVAEQVPLEAARNEIDSFGTGTLPESVRIVEGENGKSELIDTISALNQRGRNLWQVTLESGQVWRQMGSKRYNLKVGDSVRIYPSGWGDSYRLTVERISSFIQVERAN